MRCLQVGGGGGGGGLSTILWARYSLKLVIGPNSPIGHETATSCPANSPGVPKVHSQVFRTSVWL